MRRTMTGAVAVVAVLALTGAQGGCGPSSGTSTKPPASTTAPIANPDGCDAGLRPETTGLKVGATLYATVWTRCQMPPRVHLLTVTLYRVDGGKYKAVTSQVYPRIPPEVQFNNLLTAPCVPGTYVVRGDIEGTWSNGADFSGVFVEGAPVMVGPNDCQ